MIRAKSKENRVRFIEGQLRASSIYDADACVPKHGDGKHLEMVRRSRRVGCLFSLIARSEETVKSDGYS